MMITPLLLMAIVGNSSQAPSQSRVSCGVQSPSILSRSSAGVAQVSNLQLIQVECRRSPPRAMPPSGQQRPFTVEAAVFHISDSGGRMLVPSHVNASGSSGDLQSESIHFFLDIPIDESERDAASRAFLTEIARRAAASTNATDRALAARLAGMDARAMAQMVQQHRLGRFHVEFQTLDEGRPAGVADMDLEVVFKGSFFDQMLR